MLVDGDEHLTLADTAQSSPAVFQNSLGSSTCEHNLPSSYENGSDHTAQNVKINH